MTVLFMDLYRPGGRARAAVVRAETFVRGAAVHVELARRGEASASYVRITVDAAWDALQLARDAVHGDVAWEAVVSLAARRLLEVTEAARNLRERGSGVHKTTGPGGSGSRRRVPPTAEGARR